MGEQQGILKENKREKIFLKKKERKKIFLSLTKNINIYLGISLELLQSVQVQFKFRQLPFPACTSPYPQAPSCVVGVTFRDFNPLHRSFLKRFPLFIWLLFAVSSVSNFCLTQVGGGDLLFRFASSVQSCYGEGGALQTDIAVCGEHSPCSGHTGFAPYRGVCAFPVYTLLRLPAALYGAGPVLSAVPVFGYSTKARIQLRLRFVFSPA